MHTIESCGEFQQVEISEEEFAGLEIVIGWSWLETGQNSSSKKLLKQSVVLSLGT